MCKCFQNFDLHSIDDRSPQRLSPYYTSSTWKILATQWLIHGFKVCYRIHMYLNSSVALMTCRETNVNRIWYSATMCFRFQQNARERLLKINNNVANLLITYLDSNLFLHHNMFELITVRRADNALYKTTHVCRRDSVAICQELNKTRNIMWYRKSGR